MFAAVSSSVPKAERSSSVGKHKNPERTDNGVNSPTGDVGEEGGG